MNTPLTDSGTFITDDIVIRDFDFVEIDRYVLTSCLESGELEAHTYGEFEDRKAFEQWAHNNLSYEELHECPMMNAVYYYPSFVTFQEEDRSKIASATTLFYDNTLESWAVGMTGSGMDLAPHLLDTFIALGSGVPMNIAESINPKYSAYIKPERHHKNCQILAQAFTQKSIHYAGRAELLTDQSPVKRFVL